MGEDRQVREGIRDAMKIRGKRKVGGGPINLGGGKNFFNQASGRDLRHEPPAEVEGEA